MKIEKRYAATFYRANGRLAGAASYDRPEDFDAFLNEYPLCEGYAELRDTHKPADPFGLFGALVRHITA